MVSIVIGLHKSMLKEEYDFAAEKAESAKLSELEIYYLMGR